MTNDRDPQLQALFDSAKAELTEDGFANRVMVEIDAARRRTMIGWGVVGLVVAVCAWYFTATVQDAVSLLAQLLPKSLIEIEGEFVAQLLAPINSVAVPIALGFLVLRKLYKKIF